MKNTVRRPKITVSADGRGWCPAAGLLLAEAARVTGLAEGPAEAGAAAAPRTVHAPGRSSPTWR